MFKKIFNIALISLIVLLSACTKELKEPTKSQIIDDWGMAGCFKMQISPSILAQFPITTDTYWVCIDKENDGTLRLHYKGFRDRHTKPRPRMPFEMTVDIKMHISKINADKSVSLEGNNGIFQALPPGGKAINPNDVPPGISLPPGGENGMKGRLASITGTAKVLEENGKSLCKYTLLLLPNIGLPVGIKISTITKADKNANCEELNKENNK